jgi:pimeloyl-ACP methyl ester carboxylesterase
MPPTALQAGTERIRTEFLDTDAIRFEMHTCGDPRSEKLALLLHGFPEHAFSWRSQLPLFARLGYRAWAPNQRGYGQTTRPPRVADYAMRHLVDDVGALIDASGAKEVTLVGHDWGGAVAWAATLQRVRPIDRLIVMNLPHPTLMAAGLRTWRQRLRSWYILAIQIPRLPEYLLGRNGARAIGNAFRGSAADPASFPEDVLEIYRENARQPGALTAMLNWYRAAARTGRAEREWLTNPEILDVPTLMVWGELDSALGKELTYGTEALVRDFTIRYLPVAHWVQQEAPDEVNAIVSAWLTGGPVPSFPARSRPSQKGIGEEEEAS